MAMCATWALLQVRKKRAIARLFSEPNDVALLIGVCQRVYRERGDSDGATWPEHERVAALAADTPAIIGNGGFSFLFSSDLNSDLSYRLSLDALEAIGAERAARIYREALLLFPQGVVPSELERRREAVSGFDPTALESIDHRFFDELSNIERLAAKYVRHHRASFEEEWLAYKG
jgi:hypothetical protein